MFRRHDKADRNSQQFGNWDGDDSFTHLIMHSSEHDGHSKARLGVSRPALGHHLQAAPVCCLAHPKHNQKANKMLGLRFVNVAVRLITQNSGNDSP
jgi:hypothetical protein